ncbi:VWA domain-containing protein, partial [Acinetobacter baumannii]|nr:VWA domain-containing protein [Acinetobacter baumannii]
NGSFECWAFAAKTTQLDDVVLTNVNDFINTTHRGWKNWSVGARYNEEIPAIEAVINYFQKFNDQIPTYVLFISDGGVGSRREMKKILSQAAKLPIFWQFVGIGGRDYGALEKLDEMSGRIVDNCNFFSLDRIDSVSDERLYELLLQEFPDWLNAAKHHRIVRN